MSSLSRELDEGNFTGTVPMRRELSLLIMQYLAEKGCTETLHKLEQESGFYFNMKYFEEEVMNGNWDEVEKYLSGFVKVDDNNHSRKLIFEIRKLRYLEALDKHDWTKANEILKKDLKVIASTNEDLFKQLALLLALDNIRETKELANFTNDKSMRARMLVEFKKFIEGNPLLCDKLQFPSQTTSRLLTLVNHSLNMQHHKCKHPRPYPEMKTLFVDHTCEQPNSAQKPNTRKKRMLSHTRETSSERRELLFLIMQFLDEEKLTKSAHTLGQESGVYFDMKHFKKEFLNGNWDEVEKYLCGFTKVDDNPCSRKIFLDICTLKYLEAVDKREMTKAVQIIANELKMLAPTDDLLEVLKELPFLKNFREHEMFVTYDDTMSTRITVFADLQKSIEENPLLCDKLQRPSITTSRFRTLVNQSLTCHRLNCKDLSPKL